MSSYRIGGAIVAAFALVALIALGATTYSASDFVKPVVSVRTASPQDDAQTVLAERTRLQRWRPVSGPSPRSEGPTPRSGQEPALTFGKGVENPSALVRSWRDDRPVGNVLRVAKDTSGISSLPYREAAMLEQPGGRNWRQERNGYTRHGGGWLILGVILTLALFLGYRGRVPLAEGYSGQRIVRFNALERANHWMTATSFILMALTGLLLLYGRPLLLPLIGHDGLGALARYGVWLHMAFAVPFVLGVLTMIVFWLRANLPDKYDWPWLKRFGGFLNDSPDNPPADRFNTGQKFVFWIVVLGGLSLLITGLGLMFPFYWTGYDGMQWVQMAHGIVALLMIAVIFGHIYIGTVGMEDAIAAMWSGKVDRNWLKEHHSAWLDKVRRQDRPSEASVGEDDVAVRKS